LPRKNELSRKEAIKLCEQFPDLLVQEVDFTGGEPLLREDWPEISLYLNDLGITTNILTHGLDITPEKISLIKKSGISCIGISLDGLSKTHDYIRGYPGAFNKVIKNISLILEENIPLNIITTVNSLNIGELPQILRILTSLGVKFWRPQPLIPTGRVKHSKELEIESQVILTLGRFIQEWKPKAEKNNLKIIMADGMQYLFTEDKIHYEKSWKGCPAGWSTCGITSDGKVKGCLSMPDELIEGDTRKRDLWDIWFDPNSFQYSRKFSIQNLGTNCTSCDMREECKGGCSVNSYTATGLFHNDPFCYYMINKKPS